MSRLIMLRGPKPGAIYKLIDDVVTVGRGRKNDIVIDDNEVSREHCHFVRVTNSYEVLDLNSSNGTFVNGQPVKGNGGWLLHGKSIVEIGDSITFQYIPATGQFDVDEDSEEFLNLHQPYLVVMLSSQLEPEVYPLDGAQIDIGRDLDNDIVIQEPEASRNHLRLTQTHAGYMVEDLGSLNGTSVNGDRLEDARTLHFDDIIQIGTMIEMHYTSTPEKYRSARHTDLMPAVSDDKTKSSKASTDMRRNRRNSDYLGDPTLHVPSPHASRLKIMEDPPEASEVYALKPGDLEGHVFVAYARQDWGDVVAELFTRLLDSGIPTWVDQYLAQDSDDWKLAIEQALAECSLLVVVVSVEALETPYVMRCIPHFSNRAKPVVLLMYEQIKNLPMSCKDLPTISYDADDTVISLLELIALIQRHIN